MVAQPGLLLINLVSVILMSLFYGMYFVIFCMSMYLLVSRATSRQGSDKYAIFRSTVFLSGCALFIAVTGDWIVTVFGTFEAFVYFRDGTDALEYNSDNSKVSSTVGSVFLALSFAIGDFMIIYRLWVVWSFNKKVIIFPALSLTGFMISYIIAVQATSHHSSISADTALTPMFVFILVTNVYCTALISWEIWRISRNCQPIGGMDLREFLAIIVESAAMYTSWITYWTVTHQLNTNLQYIANSVIPTIGGIANALIHVRVGLGRTTELSTTAAGSTSATTQRPRVPQRSEILSFEHAETGNVVKTTV
ncbi:hypothetical protein C8R44DRAFT_760045 [Mycena epipterygia]|nr:hypothetical protein C8R44DRAFT_760045 [Mycena epipterygia]